MRLRAAGGVGGPVPRYNNAEGGVRWRGYVVVQINLRQIVRTGVFVRVVMGGRSRQVKSDLEQGGDKEGLMRGLDVLELKITCKALVVVVDLVEWAKGAEAAAAEAEQRAWVQCALSKRLFREWWG